MEKERSNRSYIGRWYSAVAEMVYLLFMPLLSLLIMGGTSKGGEHHGAADSSKGSTRAAALPPPVVAVPAAASVGSSENKMILKELTHFRKEHQALKKLISERQASDKRLAKMEQVVSSLKDELGGRMRSCNGMYERLVRDGVNSDGRLDALSKHQREVDERLRESFREYEVLCAHLKDEKAKLDGTLQGFRREIEQMRAEARTGSSQAGLDDIKAHIAALRGNVDNGRRKLAEGEARYERLRGEFLDLKDCVQAYNEELRKYHVYILERSRHGRSAPSRETHVLHPTERGSEEASQPEPRYGGGAGGGGNKGAGVGTTEHMRRSGTTGVNNVSRYSGRRGGGAREGAGVSPLGRRGVSPPPPLDRPSEAITRRTGELDSGRGGESRRHWVNPSLEHRPGAATAAAAMATSHRGQRL